MLTVTKEPFKAMVRIEYRIPSDLRRFATLSLDVASREVVHSGLSWIMGVYHHIQTKERPSEAAS